MKNKLVYLKHVFFFEAYITDFLYISMIFVCVSDFHMEIVKGFSITSLACC